MDIHDSTQHDTTQKYKVVSIAGLNQKRNLAKKKLLMEIQLFYLCKSCSRKGQQFEFYFCDNISCLKGIQCIDCVKEETAGSFCPFCLFEVTSSSAKSERNHCPRNCFYCPSCLLAPLMLVNKSSTDQTDIPKSESNTSPKPNPKTESNPILSPNASNANSDIASLYSLICSICGWDSFIDSSIILDRPTGINGTLKLSNLM